MSNNQASNLQQIERENYVFYRAYRSGQISKAQYDEAIAYQNQRYEQATGKQSGTPENAVLLPKSPEGYERKSVETSAPAPLPPNPATPQARENYSPLTLQSPVVTVTLEPKEKPTPGLAQIGLVGVQVGEAIIAQKTGIPKTFLELGPLGLLYFAVGETAAVEENIYAVPRLLGVKTPTTPPTTTGAVTAAIFGAPQVGEAYSKLPLMYQLGTVVGEVGVSYAEGYAVGKVTGYVFQKSGLAAKTQSYLNRSYVESVERTGVWQPSRTERLIMKVTGIRPNPATSIVDIPEQVRPPTSTQAVKEYPDFAEKYYIGKAEPMPKDYLLGFEFKGSPEEVAQLGKVSPLTNAMPEDYLKSWSVPSGRNAGFPTEPMPSNYLSSYGLSTSLEKVDKAKTIFTLPDQSTLARQQIAWELTQSPRTSGLLISKYLETYRPSIVASGEWSSLGLGATKATQFTETITKTVTPEATPPKSYMSVPTETKVSTRALFATPIVYQIQTPRQTQNPFLTFSGPAYYSQQRSREVEQEVIYPVTPEVGISRLNRANVFIGITQTPQFLIDVGQTPIQSPIQRQPQIPIQEQPPILRIPETTTPKTTPIFEIPTPNISYPQRFNFPSNSSDWITGFSTPFYPRRRRGHGLYLWEWPIAGVREVLGLGKKRRRRK